MLYSILMMTLAMVSSIETNGANKSTALQNPLIKVVISEQKLYLWDGPILINTYRISTSKYGVGNQTGSYQTPLGRHIIAKKIGKNARPHTIFIDRKNTGRLANIDRTQNGADRDLITSRILWLRGLEPGVNRGAGIDSYKRYIYIHGTASEGLIGEKASNGCIRMKNNDVIELFNLVKENTPVQIVED